MCRVSNRGPVLLGRPVAVPGPFAALGRTSLWSTPRAWGRLRAWAVRASSGPAFGPPALGQPARRPSGPPVPLVGLPPVPFQFINVFLI